MGERELLSCIVTRETQILPAGTVKNYKSASLLACKQSLLVNGRAKAKAAKGLGGQHPSSKRLCGQKGVARDLVARGTPARDQVTRALPPPTPTLCGSQEPREETKKVLCSEDFYNWWGGSEEVTF